jgi:hypothetical protein
MLCNIFCFHGEDYEEYRLLGCVTETSVLTRATHCHIQEDDILHLTMFYCPFLDKISRFAEFQLSFPSFTDSLVLPGTYKAIFRIYPAKLGLNNSIIIISIVTPENIITILLL